MTSVLSLGSNLGDRMAHLRLGLSLLDAAAVSPVYETAPWGDEDQQAFLNVVALVPYDAAEAWRRAVAAETAAGRVRTRTWGPRTLDVDVVWADGSDPDLVLPHPLAHERAFVLVPWLDVDPEAVLPGHGPVSQIDVDRSGVHLFTEVL